MHCLLAHSLALPTASVEFVHATILGSVHASLLAARACSVTVPAGVVAYRNFYGYNDFPQLAPVFGCYNRNGQPTGQQLLDNNVGW